MIAEIRMVFLIFYTLCIIPRVAISKYFMMIHDFIFFIFSNRSN
jgi:hypothetical protein